MLKQQQQCKKNKNKVTWLLPENNASFTVLQGGRRHCCDCWTGRWASDPFAPRSCFYKILQTFKNTHIWISQPLRMSPTTLHLLPSVSHPDYSTCVLQRCLILAQYCSIHTTPVLILGDFSAHVLDPDNSQAPHFLNLPSNYLGFSHILTWSYLSLSLLLPNQGNPL